MMKPIAFILLLQAAVFSQTYIKAGNLVDPSSGKIEKNVVIVVEGAGIQKVESGIQIPANASMIDLSSHYVLPGLIDAHTHLCTDVDLDESWQGQVTERFMGYVTQTSDAYRALTGAAKAREMLQRGFTTVRDLGNAGNYADSELRRAIENGLVEGPTMINAGRIIGPYGGQFHLQPDRPEASIPEYIHADSRDEMRKAIRENIHYGAGVIKVLADGQPYMYSVEDLKFIVDEAAAAGLKVAAHCHSAPGIRNAIEAGVASLEHGTQMSDDLLKLARDRGVALVGTEFPRWVLKLFGSEGRYPAVIDRLRRADKIGVTLVYGSDALYEVGDRDRGEMALSLLESWGDAGVSPLKTLQAMTTNAAQLLGIAEERGSIAKGQAADIIAVPGNPLESTNVLYQVQFVMKDGKVVKMTNEK